jgi:hypothetical protein
VSIANLVQVPFLSLKSIRMTSEDAEERPVLGDFLGGSAPFLEQICLDGIAVPFPAMRRLLSSTSHLNSLRLMKIPHTCYFSPEDLVTCLSALAHLKHLFVDFRSPASRPNPSIARPGSPSPERTTLHSLDALDFHGVSEYLEGFVARIDCPVLTTLRIQYFNQLIFEIPQVVQFISRVDGLKSLGGAIVQIATMDPSLFLVTRGRGRTPCYFRIPCRQLDWRLLFLTQILHQLSALLCNVHELSISYSVWPPEMKDMDPTHWLELFQPLSQISKIYVDNEHLTPDVIHALVSEDTAAGILPRLTELQLYGYRKSKIAMEAAERFVATRKLNGQDISLSG